ncbi:hypothetical protein ZIOFF_055273 [Zingiber officinale]|uniref:Uncharacterized protein n=1 Tax=Zingiber officinale TaxID=94328 RepID=A0A8J5KPU5_ZINOF|nr:hypothetical protein ZIOFF_055273 [Zingiber officinale]
METAAAVSSQQPSLSNPSPVTTLPKLLVSLSTSLSSVHLIFPFLPGSTGQFVVVGALPRLAPVLIEKGFIDANAMITIKERYQI